VSDAGERGFKVTEVADVDQPIELSPETTAAFVGRALRGPVDTPVRVRNFGEFRRHFGDCWARSSLGPAVKDFFEHGGRRLYVVRVANNARGSMLCLPASGSALVLRATEPGSSERLRAAVDYDGIDEADTEHFNLTLQRLDPGNGRVVEQEMYRGLGYRADAADSVVDRLQGSELARVDHPWPMHRPEPTLAGGNRFLPGWAEHVQAGTDGSELSDYDLVGSDVRGTGLFALDAIDDVDLLYLPPRGTSLDNGPAAILAAEMYCRRRGAMLIVDPPGGWATSRDAVSGLRALGYRSPNLMTYFPRGLPATGEDTPRAAGAMLAGSLCRADRLHGPWSGSDEDGVKLRTALAPALALDEVDTRLLVRAGINALCRDAAGRMRLVGGRTLSRGSGAHCMFKSLAVRRLCLRIVKAIEVATRWCVFEPADARRVARVREQVVDYLGRLYAQGAFDNDHFVVLCDAARKGTDGSVRRGVSLLLVFQPCGCSTPVSFTLHQSPAGCRIGSTAFAPLTAGSG
jgi:uncharacterized protein